VTGVLYSIGRLSGRFRWAVVAGWVVLLAAVAIGASAMGEHLSDNLTLPGTDSQAATDLLQSEFPDQANGMIPVVFVAPKGKTVNSSDQKSAIEAATKSYEDDKNNYSAISPYSSKASDQISKDETIAYIAVTSKLSASEMSQEQAQKFLHVAEKDKKDWHQVSVGSYAGDKLSKPSSRTSEVVGLIAAVIILLLTFGALVAMTMPIITAIFGLGVGLSVLTLVSTVSDVPTSAPALATMIGLGVGIDYGLFIVTQHRHLLAAGHDPPEAAARATATAGGAVVFAGGTVIIALLSLLVAGIPLVSTLGYTSAIVVLLAVLAAITLLPALLSIVGHHIHFGTLPWHDIAKENPKEGAWHTWAEAVTGKPWIPIIASVAVLVVLSVPMFSMTLGQTDDGSAATGTQTRESYDALTTGFGPGINGPLLIAVDMQKPAKNDQSKLDDTKSQEQQLAQVPDPTPDQQQQQQQFEQQQKFYESKSSDTRLQDMKSDIEKTDDVKTVSQPSVNDSGSAAVFQVISDSAPSDEATADLVTDLRETVLPKATKGNDETAYVGGSTAGYIDLAAQISSKLPLVIAVVLVVSFFLLMLAFRSILVPIKAVAMNLLSIGAAFGVVTYVFTHDWSAQLVGLEGPVPIVSFVPLMMFAILFGLSMDYEVFLMTHVREEFIATGDAHRAVVNGLAGTARVITSAALIMVSVFCAFVLSGDPNIKQFGVGMAAAVLIDATIVRCALVPGLMKLMGPRAWSLPRWLDRILPHFSIEGREFFEKRDSAGG
jgi:RND superfamily putative drug exporter